MSNKKFIFQVLVCFILKGGRSQYHYETHSAFSVKSPVIDYLKIIKLKTGYSHKFYEYTF